MKRVAIIGAGPAGLAAAKEARAAGIDCVIFDGQDQIGGRWARTDQSFCYDSLRSNISRDLSVFSDFPFPAGTPDFPSRDQMLDYLRSYAAHHRLLEVARLGWRVEAATPRSPGDAWTKWTVRSTGPGGERREEIFDAVLACTGPFAKPRMPGCDLSGFSGEISHAGSYRSPDEVAGERVLVVGASFSACDIASDISGSAAGVTMAIRTPFWLMAAREPSGRPTDQGLSRMKEYLPDFIRDPVATWIVSRGHKPLARFGLPVPTTRFADTPIVQSSHLADAIERGLVAFAPGVVGAEGGEVIFADGSRGAFDRILCATGYDPDPLRWLDDDAAPAGVRRPREASLKLYRKILSPKYGSLGILGHLRVQGPNFPVMEMQARWCAAVWSGQAARPDADALQTAQDAPDSRDALPSVSFVRYQDELAAEIGCAPRVFARALTEPLLFWRLWCGPALPAMYRVDGPGRWDGAAACLADPTTPITASPVGATS